MSGTVDVGVVASLGFVLNGGGVDGDTSGSFFWSFIDGAILDVFGFLLGGQILGDGGGKSGLSVIDVTDSTHLISQELPLT